LAILVVLVTTDCWPAGDDGLFPGDPHPLTTVIETAVTTAAAPAIRPMRGPLISTSPTVTSGQLAAGQATSAVDYDRL
jgi:hypothetical protein